jgi:class 3 adenylate cyclase
MGTVIDERVLAGREALERHAFTEALELLSAADAEERLCAADLDRLGCAQMWSGHLDDGLSTWERAYGAHLAADERCAAAATALASVRETWGSGRRSLAAGWYRRAERLLADEEECAVHGYLAMADWFRAMFACEYDHAVVLGERMLELGTRFGDVDLQALGLLRSGVALVARGDVEKGLGLLEEATTAAVAGQLGADATFIVYCAAVTSCRDLADYRRAGEWAQAAKRWCERRAISGFPGVCRIYHAEILRLRGAWEEAEVEVRHACGELERAGLHANAGAGFYELGEIRRRMGDLTSAEEAFGRADEAGRDPQPGLALVRLAQGRVQEAASAVSRALDEQTANRLARARLLSAQVEIEVARADIEGAEGAAEELCQIADAFGSDALAVYGVAARSEVALARGDSAGALRLGREALRRWQDLDLPYEAARARLTAAAALSAEGDHDGSALELRAAEATFTRLGAQLDTRRAAEALRCETGESPAPERSVVHAFMFTDIVKSTDLVAAIGDAAWVGARGWHDRTLRDLFIAHAGEEITHAGDGFFVAFGQVTAAIACAVEIQRSLDRHRREHGFALPVRIGLHATTAVRTPDDYAGRGVHEAARIAALADGDEILASQAAFSRAPAELKIGEPRSVQLKGLAEPLEIAAIEWRA